MTPLPPSSQSSEVRCTCKVTGPDHDQTTFDPKCPYHGKDGTMVSLIDLSKLRSTPPPKPFEPLTGGLLSQTCPHCGREI